jgi:hypothetical protein
MPHPNTPARSRSERFAAQMAERRGQTLGAFGALLELGAGQRDVAAELGVVPVEHAAGRERPTLCADDFAAIERPLLDADTDDEPTLVDYAGPDFGFFESEGL